MTEFLRFWQAKHTEQRDTKRPWHFLNANETQSVSFVGQPHSRIPCALTFCSLNRTSLNDEWREWRQKKEEEKNHTQQNSNEMLRIARKLNWFACCFWRWLYTSLCDLPVLMKSSSNTHKRCILMHLLAEALTLDSTKKLHVTFQSNVSRQQFTTFNRRTN